MMLLATRTHCVTMITHGKLIARAKLKHTRVPINHVLVLRTVLSVEKWPRASADITCFTSAIMRPTTNDSISTGSIHVRSKSFS
jgi:hypothetical protein